MSTKYVLSRETEFDEMSVDDFCKRVKCTTEDFNKRTQQWIDAGMGFTDKEIEILTKASYFYLGCVDFNEYKNRDEVEQLKKVLDCLNEMS